jgi:tRNA threonylcarbamoyladenosine biosynthesis protein TsaB
VIILALDTASESGGIAIRKDGQTIYQTVLYSADGFAHLIFPAIHTALQETSLSLDQIDCWAAASGPGSFTGIRVGLSAVKGLAEALGKRAAGISNLRAMALCGRSDRRAVIKDARRGEVFAAVYDAKGEVVSPEVVAAFPAWLASLHPAPAEFIAPAGSAFLGNLPFVEAPSNLAPAIAYHAERDAQKGVLMDPAGLDANYVRRSDAELFWKDP